MTSRKRKAAETKAEKPEKKAKVAESAPDKAPKQDLYAMAAPTQLSDDTVRQILSHYSLGKLVSTKELKGGLSNSNYRVETDKGQYLLKVCEEKTVRELQIQIDSLLILKKHGLPISYPIARTNGEHVLVFPRGAGSSSIVPASPAAAAASAASASAVESKETKAAAKPKRKGRGKAAAAEAEAETKTESQAASSGIPENADDNSKFMRIIFYDFCKGAYPRVATPTVLANLGKAVAGVHNVKFDKVKIDLPEFPMGASQWRPFLDSEVKSSAVADDPFVSMLANGLKQLEPAFKAKLPRGVVHGDIFLENTMFDGEELVALIDFEDMCREVLILDVAMCLVGCCYDREANKLDVDKAQAFLRAYESVRKLSAAERKFFGAYLRYSLLSIAFWRFRQFQVRVLEEKATRGNAYLVMVERVLALDKRKPQEGGKACDDADFYEDLMADKSEGRCNC